MAITRASLTSGNDSGNKSVYTTASVTPSANKLLLLSVTSRQSGGVTNPPTISGNGLTWVQVESVSDGNERRITVFRAMGASPSSGAITITFGANQSNCGWSLNEFDGIDTGGTNGSGAIVQAVPNTVASGTSLTITLSAFGNANNGAMSAFCIADNLAVTPDSGWTEMHEVQTSDGADSQTNQTQWRADNDTTASADWTAGGSQRAAGIAIEIKAAGGGGTSHTLNLTDSITATEVVPKSTSAVKSDSASLGETVTKSTSKVNSDSLSLTEVVAKSLSRLISDAFELVENFVAIKIVLLQLTDSVGLSETLIKDVSKLLTDSASLLEEMLKSGQRTLSDSVQTIENFTKITYLVRTDSASLSEEIKKDSAKILIDSSALSEILSKSTTKNIQEILSLTETITRDVTRIANQIRWLSEALVRSNFSSEAVSYSLFNGEAVSNPDLFNESVLITG